MLYSPLHVWDDNNNKIALKHYRVVQILRCGARPGRIQLLLLFTIPAVEGLWNKLYKYNSTAGRAAEVGFLSFGCLLYTQISLHTHNINIHTIYYYCAIWTAPCKYAFTPQPIPPSRQLAAMIHIGSTRFRETFRIFHQLHWKYVVGTFIPFAAATAGTHADHKFCPSAFHDHPANALGY